MITNTANPIAASKYATHSAPKSAAGTMSLTVNQSFMRAPVRVAALFAQRVQRGEAAGLKPRRGRHRAARETWSKWSQCDVWQRGHGRFLVMNRNPKTTNGSENSSAVMMASNVPYMPSEKRKMAAPNTMRKMPCRFQVAECMVPHAGHRTVLMMFSGRAWSWFHALTISGGLEIQPPFFQRLPLFLGRIFLGFGVAGVLCVGVYSGDFLDGTFQ